jgi:excisionase family DNA binding protein
LIHYQIPYFSLNYSFIVSQVFQNLWGNTMTNLNENQILRPRQAANALGVSLTTYYRLVTDGKLTHIKISKRTSGTTRASIDALIAAGKK